MNRNDAKIEFERLIALDNIYRPNLRGVENNGSGDTIHQVRGMLSWLLNTKQNLSFWIDEYTIEYKEATVTDLLASYEVYILTAKRWLIKYGQGIIKHQKSLTK